MISAKELSDEFDEALHAIEYPNQPAGLYQPIAYALESGGKRLRPQLLLSVCSALGGSVSKAMNAALGVEMFHNFTLLHDDVMDSADLRRGLPTVVKRWNANTAILSGDAMLTMATQLISRVDASVMPDIMELFNRTAMEVYEGQQYDMDYENRDDVTVAEYIEMIRLKTSVLLGCACRMGAMIAGADAEVADAFYEYGVNLGLAFQLRDDWLDVYGDSLVFGKQIGGDIINEKKTWLLINAMMERKEELSAILAEDLDDDERVNQVKTVYDQLRLSERCQKIIAEYAAKAVEAIKDIKFDVEARQYFTALALQSAERAY